MLKVLQDIWILTDTGLVIFNRVLDPRLDPQLFGGMLSALNTFTEEISEGGLSSFKLRNKRFTIMKQKGLTFVANSDNNQKEKKVEKELQWLQKTFFKMYGEVLKKWNNDINIFLEFENVFFDEKEKEKIKKEKTILENQKVDAIFRIENFKIMARSYKMRGKPEEAIIYAEQVIRLAIQNDLSYFIKEQEDFINSFAKNVQKENMVSEIKEFALWVDQQYDKLVINEEIVRAHDILNSFKEKYGDSPYFESIPLVRDLIQKDIKTWLKYNINNG